MSGVSLMYVSGDSHGLADNSKLQLEICTVSITSYMAFSLSSLLLTEYSFTFPAKITFGTWFQTNFLFLNNMKLTGIPFQNDCCSPRVKYARVHREKDNDVWSKTAIGPLVGGGARARSSWDLGSDADGSSTPGSASWGDMFGVIGRSATQWPPAGDFGFGKNQVFLDGGRGDQFDAWAACDAFLETDMERGSGLEFQDDAGEFSDQWNTNRRKLRKPKL